jgi:hypothetical protein
MSDGIAQLDAEIETDKAAFNAVRMRLASLLAPSMPKPGAEDIFIAHAYENGTTLTLEQSQKDAAYFGLEQPVGKGLAAKLTEPLSQANSLHDKIIENVAKRDRILTGGNPALKHTYFWMGREFTIDPKMETMTYRDTGETVAFLHDDDRPRRDPSPSKGKSR